MVWTRAVSSYKRRRREKATVARALLPRDDQPCFLAVSLQCDRYLGSVAISVDAVPSAEVASAAKWWYEHGPTAVVQFVERQQVGVHVRHNGDWDAELSRGCVNARVAELHC